MGYGHRSGHSFRSVVKVTLPAIYFNAKISGKKGHCVLMFPNYTPAFSTAFFTLPHFMSSPFACS